MAWFSDRGVTLVEEADGRLFPSTQRSSTLMCCLLEGAWHVGVEPWTSSALQDLQLLPSGDWALTLRGRTVPEREIIAGRIVLATGSHPSGRRLASQLGL